MTYIVAEIGSNWTSFDDAKDSIAMAKNCGADAVKFQMFTKEELTGFPPLIKEVRNDETGQMEPVDRKLYSEMPRDWLPKLKEKADAVGIDFLCTAFSPEGLDYVDPYVSAHKIASSDLSYPALLERAKGKGKAVFLSTGASSLSDVALALALLDKSQTTLLYCVSAYPAKDVNLFAIDVLRNKFNVDVGYSCHTTDIHTAVHASHYHQALVIEKHFKLRDMATPDNPHSLNPDQFKEMVRRIKEDDRTVHFPDPSEKAMLLMHNRRLVCIKDVAEGEALIYGKNFGCYRSLKEDIKGLSGFAWQHVNGKTAKVAFKAGDTIGPLEFA